MLLRREAFRDVGLFDPEFRIAADADWLARSMELKISSSEFKGMVLMKRIHATNLTSQARQAQDELLTLLRRKVNRDR